MCISLLQNNIWYTGRIFNSGLNLGSGLCGLRNIDEDFYSTTYFRARQKNRKWIQPVVVLCCKYNIIMRIYTKIQLVVELNLVFYGVTNVLQTRSTARGSHGYDVSSFNVLVHCVVNHDKFNPRLYFRVFLCGWRNADKCFYNTIYFRTHQKTTVIFNHRLYYCVNTTS